ncbi:Carbohydrate-responsive element-binding protein, partial [Hypsibius exemplaris]
IPKMEFTGSQDPSRYRLKSEEPDGRNPRNVEHKRINHISAEAKRRGHIKSGFEVLHGLVPSLAQNASVKVSKAVVLHKGAEYIRHLKEERRAMQAEAEALREQIETINQAVILCQQQLPATGAPVSSRARNDRMNEMLDDYVRQRTQQNWKFWLFSHIVRPLFDNFVSNVSTRSTEDLCRTTSSWVDQQCTLVLLRPLIKDSMRKLSTTTHVLSDPARLPNEARLAVQKNPSGSSSQAHSSSSTHHRSTRES